MLLPILSNTHRSKFQIFLVCQSPPSILVMTVTIHVHACTHNKLNTFTLHVLLPPLCASRCIECLLSSSFPLSHSTSALLACLSVSICLPVIILNCQPPLHFVTATAAVCSHHRAVAVRGRCVRLLQRGAELVSVRRITIIRICSAASARLQAWTMFMRMSMCMCIRFRFI